MSRLALLALITLGSTLVFADPPEVIVTSAEVLAAKGVSCHRIQHDTPMASVELDITIQPDGRLGHYESIECIVMKDDVSAEELKDTDSSPAGQAGVARRNKSLKEHSVFIVLGREIPKAYLAFEFSEATGAPSPKIRRYLLRANAVKVEAHDQASEPTASSFFLPADKRATTVRLVTHLKG